MVWSSTRSKWVSLYMLLVTHLAAVLAEDGLLLNGDFETTPSGGMSNDGLGDGPMSIPSWKSNGTVELSRIRAKTGCDVPHRTTR
ncbi:hypothetical protein F0562_013761 [Nyssa sinensis]|uniref:Uncharacterized protein n=1 Tax=Nyssa sinensis TaxID=561372 RepID=A0A5J4ZLM3_9ASTE|nr:hypothetical protein F0562_013761 [Nyssa sinensis]